MTGEDSLSLRGGRQPDAAIAVFIKYQIASACGLAMTQGGKGVVSVLQ
jgi:hypothetical protein